MRHVLSGSSGDIRLGVIDVILQKQSFVYLLVNLWELETHKEPLLIKFRTLFFHVNR